jgi:hypothetical protein
MKHPDFLICAPLQVANSHGVLALMHLAKTIEKLGRKAYVCQILGDNDQYICTEDLNTHITTDENTTKLIQLIRRNTGNLGVKIFGEFTRQRIDETYVVYPECILENPLGAKNVVRYFLNRDGILKNGARVKMGASDFTLTHSRAMQPNAQHVCHFSMMDPMFNRDNTVLAEHRNVDLTYIGKGALYGFSGKVEGTVAITRDWPRTKEELAVLLRNCRFFYTADACSNINREALSCGAIPVFIHNGPWTDAELDSFEPGAFPRMRLDSPPGDNFLAQFEVARGEYLQGMRDCEQRWEPSVREMIEKVDRHFAPQAVSKLHPVRRKARRAAMRLERASIKSLTAHSGENR